MNISASPFHVGKDREREEMLVTRARDNSCFVAFCNAVGGQDELIFDGHSFVLDDEGEVLARAPGFEEALLVVDVDPTAVIGAAAARRAPTGARARARSSRRRRPVVRHRRRRATEPAHARAARSRPLEDELEQMRLALELGLRDYVEKNGFRDVVVGVSGGIDSALTAALAAEALGPERVHCVSMPSRYSVRRHPHRRAAARREPRRRRSASSPIEPIVDAFDATLARVVRGPRARPRPRRTSRRGSAACC